MTILVLELRVPKLDLPVSDEMLWLALRQLQPKILGFVSGFVILGTLWVGHHYQFHYIRRSNRTLIWINLGFLLAVSSLPFVIAMVGAYGPTRMTCILYGGTLSIAGTILCGQWLYAANPKHGLVGPSLSKEAYIALRNRVAVGAVGYTASTLLALVSPIASLGSCVAISALYLTPSNIDRHVNSAG